MRNRKVLSMRMFSELLRKNGWSTISSGELWIKNEWIGKIEYHLASLELNEAVQQLMKDNGWSERDLLEQLRKLVNSKKH
jgi:hypothetical protein